tara:strand:- start:11061 stop:14360 length:3300 start_codon:yes stop_codon:yes gene_type:complete
MKLRYQYIISILFIASLFGQFKWYNHPELEWRTIETEHFKIHYHQGTERSAREAAEVAEYVYKPITDLYDFRPKNKTEIVIKDVDDYSNGAAYFFENMIEIWAKPLDYDLRGSHRWMQDVIAHEFTHIVQLGRSMKFGNKILGSYVQKLGYEDEKREDVLYGYPNEIISYPVFPGVAIPMWLAEGTAQHMYDELFFDYWDSIRDMLLRDRILNDKMYTFQQMNSFGKCGMGNELVYNFGYSLVGYISDNYGDSSLKNISQSMSKPFNYSINRAIEESIGITGDELYLEWKQYLEKKYDKQISDVDDQKNYVILEDEGITNVNPRWSPGNQMIAYLSDKNNDYFGRTDLFIYNLEDSTHQKIKSGVRSIPAWINDSLIVYTKLSKPNKDGSKYFDLYITSFGERKDKKTGKIIKYNDEEQLTEGLRLYSPVYDEINDKIIAINTYDGTSNIVVGNNDFSEYKILTDFNDGMQIYSLSLYDDKYLIDAVRNHERDLYLVNPDSGELSNFINVPWDVRDPNFNNQTLIYSDDKSGIYNLYIKSKDTEGYITDLSGGAFKPDISDDGKVVFSIYQDGGYKLAIMEKIEIINSPYVTYDASDKNNQLLTNYTIQDSTYTYDNLSSSYHKRPTSVLIDQQFDGLSKEYEDKMTGPFFFPRIMFDYNTVKPGLYFFDNEALRSLSVLGGITMNSKKDLDLSLLFDYNKNLLTYYFNFYWMSRHTNRDHFFKRANGYEVDNIIYDVDYMYHLFSTDIGSRFIYKDHKFWMYYTYNSSRQFYFVNMSQELNDEYIEDFLYGNEPTSVYFKGAYDYYRGHAATLKYEYDARKRHYLYTMLPSKGFKINSMLSYEKNNIFEKFRVNEDFGSFLPYLASHDTWRLILDVNKYWRININSKEDFISIKNNIVYSYLSNDEVNDFVYFFGGGFTGLKGYTYYEPTLQGPELFMLNNEMHMKLFSEKTYGPDLFSLSAASIGIITQFGKANNSRIISQEWSYTNITESQLSEWFDTDDINNLEFDALDKDNNIPEEYENDIIVNVYGDNPDNEETMKNLKNRYNRFKQTFGISFKVFGFSFYSYPTAISYEWHVPYKDNMNNQGRHYLKILFDF